MTTRIVVRALADAQFAEAHNRLNLSRRGRGEEFLLAVDERLETLANFPFSCSVDFDDVRKAQIKGFPYLLLYLLRDFENERRLIVLACVHHAPTRKRGAWKVKEVENTALFRLHCRQRQPHDLRWRHERFSASCATAPR